MTEYLANTNICYLHLIKVHIHAFHLLSALRLAGLQPLAVRVMLRNAPHHITRPVSCVKYTVRYMLAREEKNLHGNAPHCTGFPCASAQSLSTFIRAQTHSHSRKDFPLSNKRGPRPRGPGADKTACACTSRAHNRRPENRSRALSTAGTYIYWNDVGARARSTGSACIGPR